MLLTVHPSYIEEGRVNIYVSSYDPNNAAWHLDDRLLLVAIKYAGQLLSNGMVLGPLPKVKLTAPHTVWVTRSTGNYRWLFAHFVSLLNVYHERFFRDHKYVDLLPIYAKFTEGLEDGDVTDFPNITKYPETYDVRDAYRYSLQDTWGRQKRPTRGGKPFNFGAWRDRTYDTSSNPPEGDASKANS